MLSTKLTIIEGWFHCLTSESLINLGWLLNYLRWGVLRKQLRLKAVNYFRKTLILDFRQGYDYASAINKSILVKISYQKLL